MGRKTASKGKEYARIWVYIPTKVTEDTAFPFKIGAPCSVEIDEKKNQLIIKPMTEKEALEFGWRKRERRTYASSSEDQQMSHQRFNNLSFCAKRLRVYLTALFFEPLFLTKLSYQN